jgi:ERCC4 domain
MFEFVVARNPLAGAKFPYIICVPLDRKEFWFLAKETWPRSSRVFCWPIPHAPRGPLEIVDRAAVRSCTMVGQSINLLLQRRSRYRSQFVFVTSREKHYVFWQTAKAAQSARPGSRIPRSTQSVDARIYIDSRERYGYTFPPESAERRTLSAGDYAVLDEEGCIFAAVERKTAADFATSIVDASLSFEMLELTTFPHAAVVVEESYSHVLRHAHTRPGYIPDLIARLSVLYPKVPIVFLESRSVAKEWVSRFLQVAHANAREKQIPLGSDASSI